MPSKQPKPLFLEDANLCLATDLYQLTMIAGYFECGKNHKSTFELFVRNLPEKRTYLIAAGLEQAIYYLRKLRFTDEYLKYLRDLPVFKGVSRGFFDHLRNFRFSGDVYAVPEGTVIFTNEPIIRITAPPTRTLDISPLSEQPISIWIMLGRPISKPCSLTITVPDSGDRP